MVARPAPGGRAGCYGLAPPSEAVASMPPNPMVSTAVEGTITSREISLGEGRKERHWSRAEGMKKTRCGGRGLRTFAVRARPPMVGAASSKTAEALHTNSIAGSLKLLGLVSVGDPKGAPGLVPQCFRTSPKISPSSTHPRFPGVCAVRPLTGLRRTQYHLKCNASRPGRKLLGPQCGGADLDPIAE
jgi:hypothetical protein